MDDVAFKKMDDRLIHYLKKKSKVTGSSLINLTHQQIADELGTTEITIKVHRGRVMRKMQAASLPDLVRMAEKLEFPPPTSYTKVE